MEIEEFHEEVLEEIKFQSSIEGTSNIEELIRYFTDIMIDAEEIDDFNYVLYEGVGRRNKSIQVDGYSYNELDEVLSLFICPKVTYGTIETITSGDAEKIFSDASAFIKQADYICEYAEESAPGYGLAYDILHKYKTVKKYRIYLLTDMVMSQKIKVLSDDVINGIVTEYNIWDLSRIFQIIESGRSKEEITINLKDFSVTGIPCLPASKTPEYTAYLCNIPGMLLANLYNTYGGRLLEGNVRSFLQTKGKVNKGIRVTILNNPSLFFAYNNGIAATATNIKTEIINGVMNIVEISDLQIVNGGQTTASLANSLINDKKDNSESQIQKIFVPMKLSVVSHEKAQELIPNISRYANSQNKVSEADLWSNHPFHIRLEEFSRKTIAPAVNGKQYGTYWYYERANGQYKQETYKCTPSERKKFEMLHPSNQMFKKTDLAKYWNIMEMRPDIASAGGTKAFARLATYVSNNWEKNDTVFNKDFFERIVAIAIIFKETDKIVKQQEWYNSYKANIVAYTISKLIFTINDEQFEYTMPYHDIWLKQGLGEGWQKQLAVTSKIMYEHLINENRQVENVTEWAKREKCWDEAKKIKIQLLPEFIKELQYKYFEKQDKKDAKKDQKLNNSIQILQELVKFGSSNWKYLIQWNETHNVLSPKEIEFIKVATKIEQGKIPSDKQSVVIMKILEHAREEGFPR